MPRKEAIEQFELAGETFYKIMLDDIRTEIGPLIIEINVLRAKVATLEKKLASLGLALKD